MKNVLTIIKKEFARFFKDRRMVITVLLPGILIYLVYSLMGVAMGSGDSVDTDYKYTAYVENMPANDELAQYLNAVLAIDETVTADDYAQRITDGTLDLAVIFPDDFDEALNGTAVSAPDVKIYYNFSEDVSCNGYATVSAILEAFKNPAFSVNKDGNFNLAEEKDSAGKILATFLPMLMFALLVSGSVAVAPEAIAGEKERGTMATMLITPVKRWQIALGKILSLTCFAMLSGISSFIGLIFSLPKLMDGMIDGSMAAYYTAGDYFMIFGLIVSVVLVIISAFSVVSAYAKSVKEAGTLIAPLMILIILFGLFTMFISNPSIGLFAIPLLGSGLAISAVLTFSITPLAFVLAVISNIVIAAALVVLLNFMFKSEKIMFNK